jgi:hypothetical protein
LIPAICCLFTPETLWLYAVHFLLNIITEGKKICRSVSITVHLAAEIIMQSTLNICVKYNLIDSMPIQLPFKLSICHHKVVWVDQNKYEDAKEVDKETQS